MKDQKSCGSCWAFSITGAIEENCNAVHEWKDAKQVDLSEQELVDCASEKLDKRYFECAGCEGGWMSGGALYNQINGGQMLQSAYPYTGKDDACKATASSERFCHVKKFIDLADGDFEGLKNAAADGAVGVGVYVDFKFQFYSKGVFTSKACKGGEDSINHGVVLSGYGQEDGKDFWEIKNSWGGRWGNKGFMKLGRSDNEYAGNHGCILSVNTAILEVEL